MEDDSGRGNSWSKGRNKLGLFQNRLKAGILDKDAPASGGNGMRAVVRTFGTCEVGARGWRVSLSVKEGHLIRE